MSKFYQEQNELEVSLSQKLSSFETEINQHNSQINQNKVLTVSYFLELKEYKDLKTKLNKLLSDVQSSSEKLNGISEIVNTEAIIKPSVDKFKKEQQDNKVSVEKAIRNKKISLADELARFIKEFSKLKQNANNNNIVIPVDLIKTTTEMIEQIDLLTKSSQTETAMNDSYDSAIANLNFQQAQKSETFQRLQNRNPVIDAKIKALESKLTSLKNSPNEINNLETELQILKQNLNYTQNQKILLHQI